eukprot:g48291.t1
MGLDAVSRIKKYDSMTKQHRNYSQILGGGVIVTLEEDQDGHVVQGVGGGDEMVPDWKVLSFVPNRAQVLYKAVSEPSLGLTDVREATSGAVDAISTLMDVQ